MANEKLIQKGLEAKARLEERAKSGFGDTSGARAKVYGCNSTSCRSAGGESVIDSFNQAVDANELSDQVRIVPTGCMGLCAKGPLVKVVIDGMEDQMFKEVEPMVARLIVAEYITPVLEGKISELPEFLKQYTLDLNSPFFASQQKIVLQNLGHINPESIDDYVDFGGYQALKKCLFEMSPQDVVNEIKESGLRGRGGGGFPTGLKWQFSHDAEGDEKFVICNGDEGDPGAYMDSGVLEGDPHAVIEGMLIAGYAQRATSGWLYIRAEYPLAIKRIENAIRQARKNRLLGDNILGSDFSFDLEVRLGAGAFVCGEETALIASIEGKRGTPRPRPPYPTESGLWKQPSSINNVETFANIAKIINMGAKEYSKIGTDKSKGTKVFALTGRVRNGGLVEVPMGMTLDEIVNQVGGGVDGDAELKAVQTGGPSGGVIPKHLLDLPVCYDELKAVGSIMGSGGMIVMDEDDSLVDIAKFYLGFTVEESCGKCAPCRIGGQQMLDKLTKIAAGDGKKQDVTDIKRIAHAMQKASLCGLGQTAPNPVLSTLKFFESEYTDKIKECCGGCACSCNKNEAAK